MYHYAGNNPVRYSDPDGKFAETAWDVFSLSAGIASLAADIKVGNVKGAIIDSLGIVADAAAVAIPCIPGGAGAAIKATRITGAVANVAGGSLSVYDGLVNGDFCEAGLGAIQAISGVGEGIGVAKRISNENTAYDFYTNSGMSKSEAKSHMQGIDFSRKVNITNLDKGTVVDQYQMPGGRQGRYYTPQGGNPNTLGINTSGRVRNSYTINQTTSVLQSSAANTSRNKNLDPAFRGNGGGTQYFSNEYQNFTPME